MNVDEALRVADLDGGHGPMLIVQAAPVLAAEVRRLRRERDTWQSSAREWESHARCLEVERDRMGTLPFEAAFLVHGEPEQLIFRGPTGQVVLRRLRDEEEGS